MVTVVGVRFRRAGKIYYFNPGELKMAAGDGCIVETSRGVEFGRVVVGPREVPEEEVVQPLKQVIRCATSEDYDRVERNRQRAQEAFEIALGKISEHGLPMKLLEAEYTLDESKLIFSFTAEGRVDFRELVKDLAAIFRTRIELRQVGVRDEAKLLGGLGPAAISARQFSRGFRACFHQDGQRSKPLVEPCQDLRSVRPTHVLPEVRVRHLPGMQGDLR